MSDDKHLMFPRRRAITSLFLDLPLLIGTSRIELTKSIRLKGEGEFIRRRGAGSSHPASMQAQPSQLPPSPRAHYSGSRGNTYGSSHTATPQLRRFPDGFGPSVSPQFHRRQGTPLMGMAHPLPSKSIGLNDTTESGTSVPQIMYLQRSPLETHKARMQHKLKSSLSSLATLCLISAFTAYFSYRYADTTNYSPQTGDKAEHIFGHPIHVSFRLREALFVASWCTFLSSLGTVVIVGCQLFFALKVTKDQPDRAEVALTFLAEGKYVRVPVVVAWFVSIITFVFLLAITPFRMSLENIPKGICIAVGIIVAVSFLFGVIQAVYSFCRIDPQVVATHYSLDERFDYEPSGRSGLSAFAPGTVNSTNGVNYSTLV
uniref:MARVEL domain-containing protein n=1 Tax=Panagrellus redivivus TaxID=6233 RepID=A0A7E4V9I3_PANRE